MLITQGGLAAVSDGVTRGLLASVASGRAALSAVACRRAQAGRAAVADAAMARRSRAVRALLKQAADVNAPQGDGMTALHWAASSGDAELVQMLVHAGANVQGDHAARRLHAAAAGGAERVTPPRSRRPDRAGADVEGRHRPPATTPLMLAAAVRRRRAGRRMLVERGADVNARETAMGQTALMFAAAHNRVDVVKLLLARGADVTRRPRRSSTSAGADGSPEEESRTPAAAPPQGSRRGRRSVRPDDRPGVDPRSYRYNELVGTHGRPHAAALRGAPGTSSKRRGAARRRRRRQPGERRRHSRRRCSLRSINGHFDLASYLLEHGADPNLASDNGVDAALRGAQRAVGAEGRCIRSRAPTCSRSCRISIS